MGGKYFLSFLIVGISQTVQSDVQELCANFKSPFPYRGHYCIRTDPKSHNPDVIYEFHGLGADDYIWIKSKAYKRVREMWVQDGKAFPTVVSISFGNSWLVTDKNRSLFSGLKEFLFSKMFPFIEKKLGGKKGRRTLLGTSMGGFNSLELFAADNQFFDRMAITCPAVATINPHAKMSEVRAYLNRTQASAFKVLTALSISRSYFPSPKDWDIGSPIAKFKNNFKPNANNAVYLTTVFQDEYGFQEGTRALRDLFVELGMPVHYEEFEGGHCTIHAKTLADFLNP